MGRPVALTNDPPSPPYVCVMCKGWTQIREWFVDTGAETEWDGIIYICNACMYELVRVSPDFMSVQAHQEIVAEFNNELDQYADLQRRLELVEDAFVTMTGTSFWDFFNVLGMVRNYGRLVVSDGPVFGHFTDLSQPVGDSEDTKSDDNVSTATESEPSESIIQFG